MMIRKRGQLLSQPFVYIFALVVGALILVFFFFFVLDLKKTADFTELSTFVNKLQDVIDGYGNFDVGSSKKISLSLPGKVEKVCFVNPDLALNTAGLDDFFASVLQSNKKNNLFILPLDAFPSPAPDFFIEGLIVLSENPLCVETDGVLKISVETMLHNNKIFVDVKRV